MLASRRRTPLEVACGVWLVTALHCLHCMYRTVQGLDWTWWEKGSAYLRLVSVCRFRSESQGEYSLAPWRVGLAV